MADLTTTYLGLQLKHPVVAASSPLSKSLDQIRRLEDAGAAAVVMYSLFEEQITHESRELDHYLTRGSDTSAEAAGYFPDMDDYNLGPEGYVDLIAKAKQAVKVPIIGSLNGVSPGGWLQHAKLIEQAGADAIELNLYYLPSDPQLDAATLENNYREVVATVREAVRIPLAVKLSPNFTALPNFAAKLAAAGANGLVLFNRFYQPDFDLDQLEVVPHLSLSASAELRLPLRWTAILHGRIKADLALSGGVHTSEDVIKAMMAGAKCTMIASELLMHGTSRIGDLVRGLHTWLNEKEYTSISQMQGSMSQQNVAAPAAFERANYLKTLSSWDEAVR